MYCTQCGAPADSAAARCGGCGAELRVAPTVATGVSAVLVDDRVDDLSRVHRERFAAARSTTAGVLVVTRGEVVGGVFALTGEITTVGRHGASDVFLDDVTVSRRHAEIRRTLNEYAVFDLASLNGTYLNEVRVETAVLRDGDLLQIGKFKLMFLEASAP